MVVLGEQKERFIIETYDNVDSSLREERRRTGRYVAAGTAIFLSLLGLHQALERGTPEYAALFLPALIMFIYILWILYATKSHKKYANEIVRTIAGASETLQEENINEENNVIDAKQTATTIEPVKIHKKPNEYTFCRTYSIA